MGSQNRWLLPSQEARQDRPATGSQGASQVGSHYRQRAREDVGEDQIEAALLEGSILITIGPADPYEPCHSVPGGIMARDADRILIDVPGEHVTAQELRCRNRQYPGSGSHIQQTKRPALPRQPFERRQAPAGRSMLARAECRCRIDCDADLSGRDRAAEVRAVNEETTDSLRRERQLIFGEPVASSQPLLSNLDQHAARRRGSQRELDSEPRRQRRRARIGFETPFLCAALECRNCSRSVIEDREYRTRRFRAANAGSEAPHLARAAGPHPSHPPAARQSGKTAPLRAEREASCVR